MTPPEPGTFDVALKFAPLIAAGGIWVFGIMMWFQNRNRKKADDNRAEADKRRAEAEKNRHTESMTALKDAAEDRKAAQAAAVEDRKVTQGMLAALQELIRRTSPPSSQAGPQPGPAE